MVKNKGPVWNFFNGKGKGVSCKYCSKEYKQANAVKMERHIKKCFKCPTELKNILVLPKNKTLSPTSNAANVGLLRPLTIDTTNTAEKHNTAELSVACTGPSSSSSKTTSSNLVSPCSSTSAAKRALPFWDQMDSQTNETLNQSLAKAVFISGSPLSIVEHPLWIEFFKKIRPSFVLPSRYRLSNAYLDAQYTEMQSEINKLLEDTKNLYLQCDGWSNIRNESIVNFVVSKPEPYFVDFKMTKTERHTAEYLAEIIGNVLEKYDPNKFLVVIADNAANMRAALTILTEKYPHIVPLGCIAHLLHLLCSDILGCETVKQFFASVIEIVKKIKQSHLLRALFDEISKEKNFKDRVALKLPGNTRWGSHLFCLKSVQGNKVVLQTLAVNEKAELEPSLKRRLLDDSVFWPRVESMVVLLNPIVQLITSIESNEPQIHRVVSNLNELEQILEGKLPLSPLLKAEENKVMTQFKKRKEFAMGPIHMAANLLDPKVQGSDLDAGQLLDAISFICDTAKHMKLDVSRVRGNLADYRDKEGLWSRKFLWEGFNQIPTPTKSEISPLLWWRTLRGTCELADVAIRILGAPVTSAATERTFSTFSWIHSKKRNRLTSEKAAKLTYLSYNWKLMNPDLPSESAFKKPKSMPTFEENREDTNSDVVMAEEQDEDDVEDEDYGEEYEDKESDVMEDEDD